MVTWGLKEQDLEKCHFADATCVGKTVWDHSFNMGSVEAQQGLLVRYNIIYIIHKNFHNYYIIEK